MPTGPDKIALQTLRIATWTLAASIFALIATVIGNVIAVRDFNLNLRQWRRLLERESQKPELYVTFGDDKTVLEQHYREVMARTLQGVAPFIRLHNSGNAPARKVNLALILPQEVRTPLEVSPEQRHQLNVYLGTRFDPDEQHKNKVWAHVARSRRDDGSIYDEWTFDLVPPGDYIEAGRLPIFVLNARSSTLKYRAVCEEGIFPPHGFGTLEVKLTADQVNEG